MKTVKASESTKASRAEAFEKLRSWIKPGDTVYTVLRSASRSGMSRKISLFVLSVGLDGKPWIQDITGWAGQAMGRSYSMDDGIRINGCGMDMGYALVEDLASAVFGRDTRGIGPLNQRWL